MASAREAESAEAMPDVPKGRGFAGRACWASFFEEESVHNNFLHILRKP